MIKPPAISTVHAVLDRHGGIKRRKRRRYKARGTALHGAMQASGLWCADYKGEFKLGNRQYCYPLTITDYHSRYLLACEGLTCTKSDFASPHALFGLSRLSVWWLRLGITIERIKPGNPQQNGRHERMHLTLKKEAAKPAAFNFLQQQERFDRFIEVYNNGRPHQGLAGACPGELYTPSTRVYQPPDEPDYPLHDRTVRVTRCGRICIWKRKINLSQVFAGQILGLREVEIWIVSFLDYDLGFFGTVSNRHQTHSPRR